LTRHVSGLTQNPCRILLFRFFFFDCGAQRFSFVSRAQLTLARGTSGVVKGPPPLGIWTPLSAPSRTFPFPATLFMGLPALAAPLDLPFFLLRFSFLCFLSPPSNSSIFHLRRNFFFFYTTPCIFPLFFARPHPLCFPFAPGKVVIRSTISCSFPSRQLKILSIWSIFIPSPSSIGDPSLPPLHSLRFVPFFHLATDELPSWLPCFCPLQFHPWGKY